MHLVIFHSHPYSFSAATPFLSSPSRLFRGVFFPSAQGTPTTPFIPAPHPWRLGSSFLGAPFLLPVAGPGTRGFPPRKPHLAAISPSAGAQDKLRAPLLLLVHGALLSSFSVPDRHLGSAHSSPSYRQQHPLPCCYTPPLHSLATKLLPASMHHPWSSPMD